MTFGHKKAARTFQRFVDNMLRDLPYVFSYLDDFLVASRSSVEQKQHLREVFKRLIDYGLALKFSNVSLDKSQ